MFATFKHIIHNIINNVRKLNLYPSHFKLFFFLSPSLSLTHSLTHSVYPLLCLWNDISNVSYDLAGQVSVCKKNDVLMICFLFSFQLFSYCIHKIPLAWTPLLRPTTFHIYSTEYTHTCNMNDMICLPRVRCPCTIHTTQRGGDCADVLIRFRPSRIYSITWLGMCVSVNELCCIWCKM